MRHGHHPRHAEAVGGDAEEGREEGLGQWHAHTSTVGHRVESLRGFRVILRFECE